MFFRYEFWFLKLGEEHRQRMSENRKLRKVFRNERAELTGENCARSCILCIRHQIL
jgi:hypothetical protein